VTTAGRDDYPSIGVTATKAAFRLRGGSIFRKNGLQIRCAEHELACQKS